MLVVLPVLSCLGFVPVYANWEYDSEFVGGGWYNDDGARFVLSVRGGASYGHAKIQNDIGELTPGYRYKGNSIMTEGYYQLVCQGSAECDGYLYAGFGNIGELSAKEDYSKLAFTAGASVGWVVPNHTNWRLEVGWDRIAETEYNESPLFTGDLSLMGGGLAEGNIVNVQSGSAHSTVSTDIISVMAFYDFFDGIQKPSHELIPYIGLGAGYANSETTLQLVDSYADLSMESQLYPYGEGGGTSVLEFYKSKSSTSNIAGVLAFGVSYGLDEKMFLDFGARFMYVPKIKWTLANEDNTSHRDWFSAKNMIYTNVMLGLRFEF